MNYNVLSAVIDELALLLPGATVERVLGSTANDICLELHQRRKKLHLLLSPDRALPRLHLLSEKPETTALSHAFPLFLKSRVTGGRLSSIRLLNQDRIVEIVFLRRDAEFHLLFELIGRASNLVVTDINGVILAVLYPSPVSDKNTRLLLPGLRYEAPGKRTQPEARSTFSALPSGNAANPNRAEELKFEQIMTDRLFDAAVTRMGSVLRKAQHRTRRRRDALLEDLARSEQAMDHKQAGELILANLERLRSGMPEAELTGHDGTTRLISLDRRLTPVRNAELYFKRYKKAKAGRAIISARLQEAEEALVFLAELQARLENARDEADLTGVEAGLREKGYVKPLPYPGSSGGVRKPLPASLPVRRIQFRGWEVVVGKSAAGNDYISTKLARADDLWFHADGIPGSHVLIRNPERRDIPPEVIARAASLAAYYSKGRTAGKVAVTFTLCRNVKKPKGTKAGLVTVSERSTIMAVPSEE